MLDMITSIYSACIDKFSVTLNFSLELVKFDTSTCALKRGIRICMEYQVLPPKNYKCTQYSSDNRINSNLYVQVRTVFVSPYHSNKDIPPQG